MDEFIKEIDRKLNLLIEEFDSLSQVLDVCGKRIVHVEEVLRSNPMHALIPFDFRIEGNDLPGIFHLIWKKPENQKKFRLVFRVETHDGELIVEKPFVEVDIKTRIAYYRHIDGFLEEYHKILLTFSQDIHREIKSSKNYEYKSKGYDPIDYLNKESGE